MRNWRVLSVAFALGLLIAIGLFGCGKDSSPPVLPVLSEKGSQTCQMASGQDGLSFACGGEITRVPYRCDGRRHDGCGDPMTCTVEENEDGATIKCPDGTTATIRHGRDGSSCSASEVKGGVLIQCTDGTTALIKNGRGVPESAAYLEETIDPCGKQCEVDEVLLKFSNGEIFGHYADGRRQFFTRVEPGDYVTSDGSHCRFTVTEEGEVVWD